MHASTQALRIDGYIRVSRVGLRRGERFISPQIQREQITEWAAAKNARLLTIYEELDTPGRRRPQPKLAQAIARVADGTSQGIVVWRVSRFGRSLIRGLTSIEQIREAGGTFFSVADGLDTSTETGRLVLRIMLSMAEWELEGIQATWRVAREKAIDRGVYCGAFTPIGYKRLPSGRLQSDPKVAPLIPELFERRANGEMLVALARTLEQLGVPTATGNPVWSCTTTANLLRNRAYLGEVRSGEHTRVDAHQPLVDESLWQRAQTPRRPAPKHARAAALLMGGLLVCAGCGRSLRFGGNQGRGVYQCGREFAGGRCPEPAVISAPLVEACVEDIVFHLLERRRRAPTQRLQRASERVVNAQAAVQSYRDNDRLPSVLGPERFADGLAIRTERLRAATVELDALNATLQVHALPTATELEERWMDMGVDERRQVISTVLDCAVVSRAASRSSPEDADAERRVLACPAGTGPRPQPKPRKGARPRRIQARRAWVSLADVEVPRRWGERRLVRELESFLAGRETWPSRAGFHAAGAVWLHRQVLASGGEEYWACRFGLAIDRPPGGYWTDARIRTALNAYLRDKTEWPTTPEFEADGYRHLRTAVTTHGGVRRWAPEMGLDRTNLNNGPRRVWTDDRIRSTLTWLCADRRWFPTEREFTALHLSGMHGAMRHGRSVRAWVDEMGLPQRHGGSRLPGPTRTPLRPLVARPAASPGRRRSRALA
jgi:DNA invertase Pin-like site-specific DNA recombinase